MMSSMRKRAVFIVGGTGIGKTQLGVQLALALNGEVVNSDAMQLYRALPIATAQPAAEERRGVPHHLLGVLGANESWTVRNYRDRALAVMDDIWARGKLPVVVGGTLYYVQSLIWRSLLDERPGFEEDRSAAGQDEDSGGCAAKRARVKPPAAGAVEDETPYEQLKRLDPVRAAQLHPHDERRIERSLEVLLETGKSHVEAAEDPADVRLDCRILWLSCEDQTELERRLKARIENMLASGLVEEAAAFLREYDVEENGQKGVFQAIGFRELEGLISEPSNTTKRLECMERLLIKHRQYVKSQLKWIRNRVLTRTVPVHKLDATDKTKWDTNVLEPALDIVRMYQSGADESDILSKYPVANTFADQARDTKTVRTCDLCNGRVLVGEEQWLKHIRGRPHRKQVELQKRSNKAELQKRNNRGLTEPNGASAADSVQEPKIIQSDGSGSV